MKPNNEGAHEVALKTNEYPLSAHTPPLYQLTAASPDPSTTNSHSTAQLSSPTSASSQLTPLPPRKSKLQIKWATDSDSSSSGPTSILPPPTSKPIKIVWESSSDSDSSRTSVPSMTQIPPTHTSSQKSTSSLSSMDATPTYDARFQADIDPQQHTTMNTDPDNNSTVSDNTPRPIPSIDPTSSVESPIVDNNRQTININNLDTMFMQEMNNTLIDSLGTKCDGDFRRVFQNPNGIKVYQDGDPDYLPSIKSFKENSVDMVCLAETNVPWHKNDLRYNISKQNQITWSNPPVKTVASSRRIVTHTSPNYQPGGCMTIVTNTMTTKIKNATSDYLGRWTRVNFFATKGTMAIYTLYRSNKSSLRQAGGDTVWM